MKIVTLAITLALALVGTSSVAFAKKHATSVVPTHHCQLHGTEVPKAKKACLKAGGTWEMGTPAAAAKSAPAAVSAPVK